MPANSAVGLSNWREHWKDAVDVRARAVRASRPQTEGKWPRDSRQDAGRYKVVAYLSTYLANIRFGSIAMNSPRLRASTSPFWFRISAILMCRLPRTLTSRDSTRNDLFRGTGFK